MNYTLSIILGQLDSAIPLPVPDPMGYPVPAWILQALAYLTLTLHFSAVHFTIGGGALLLWSRLRRTSEHQSVARFFGAGLPLGVSYIVTLGIPPLLFLQVLYGQLFYSSSILLGAFWIQVIPVMILAYGGVYYHKMRIATRPRFQGLVVASSLLLLLYVGFLYASNLTLLMTPDKWLDFYSAAPAGTSVLHGEPTLHGRIVLFLASSFGVAGLALIWRGVFLERWGFATSGQFSRSMGFKAFIATIVLWIVGGVGVYVGRPDDVRAFLTSGVAPISLLVVGAACAIVAVVGAYRAASQSCMKCVLVSSLAMVLVTVCIVVLRDLARINELRPIWTLADTPVNAQWGMFGLFVATLAGGVILLVVLCMKVFPPMAAAARERLARQQ